MKIAYFSNFLNHHQIHISRELYSLTHGDYYFVEMIPMPESFIKSGYPCYSDEPFVVKAWENNSEYNSAVSLADEADVVIYTPYAFDIVKQRLTTNKISIDVGERWFKQGIKNILSPTLLKMQWFYHTRMNKDVNYKLCSSAFGAGDQYKLHSFKDKCYKWGYFTAVEDWDISSLPTPRNAKKVSLMWCSRFIDWKHPELPILLAQKLKEKGFDFTIDMYGGGVLEESVKTLAKKIGVTNVVNFFGNVQNLEIITAMRKHDIFLFTSDRNEGWGAVANEAMANGCVVVGSHEIGSIPYLIQDLSNGCVFKSKDVNSLFDKVTYLINNPETRKNLAIKAYDTISKQWSPANAARNLMDLLTALLKGKDTPIIEGPCSKALPMIDYA